MREFERNETRWTVREVDTRYVPGARGPRCLIYESEGLIRRVWSFPDDWDSMSVEQLWRIVDRDVPVPGRPAPATADDLPAPPREAGDRDDGRKPGDPRAISHLTRSLFSELVGAREIDAEAGDERRARATRCRTTQDDMRAAIAAYARSLRVEGVPPERAVVLMKDAVQKGLAGACVDEPVAEALLNDGVEWCIDAYYQAGD